MKQAAILAHPADFAMHMSAHRWQAWPHLRLLGDALQRVAAGECPRLIVSMPPRHGKSQLISQWFPVYALNLHPEWPIMLTSYGATLAARFGRWVRNQIAGLGDRVRVKISPDSAAADRWHTTAGGGMITAGVGGAITGMGARVLIVDDPFRNWQDSQSPVIREHTWDWWQSTAYTRLEPGGAAIIVQTRWHQDDLAGRLIREMEDGGERWEVLNLPAIAETGDPLGRAVGAPLCPERYDLPALQRIERAIGDAAWQAEYQGRPTAPGGQIYRREWWEDGRNRYHAGDAGLSNRVVARYISWDTALKDTATAAYTACTIAELTHDYRLLIRRVWRDRVTFPDLPDAIDRFAHEHNADGKLRGVLIEDKASGISAIQTLRATAPAWLRELIIAFEPGGDKTYRANQAAVWCRNGSVLLPHPSADVPWLHDFEAELYGFPNGAYKDQADAFAQVIIYLEHLLRAGLEARGGYAA